LTSISKTFDFHAAHRLPNHDGKCRRLHGHTYRVDIMITGNIIDTEGDSSQAMVIDFGVLKDIWKGFDEHLDHHALLWDKDPLVDLINAGVGSLEEYGIEVTPVPPTAEHIAEMIFRNLWAALAERPEPVILDAVRVWETPTSWALFDGRHIHIIQGYDPGAPEGDRTVISKVN